MATHRASAVGNVDRQYEPGPAPRPAVSRRGWPRGGDPHLSATDTGRLGVRSLTLSRLAKARKRQNIYKCRQKCVISIAPKDTKSEFWDMVFHMSLEFSDCDELFLRKLSESGRIIDWDTDNQRAALAGMATRSTLPAPVGERDPYCSYSARLGCMRRHRKTERCTTSQLN